MRGITSDARPVECDTVPKDKKDGRQNHRKTAAQDSESVTLVSNTFILHFAGRQ